MAITAIVRIKLPSSIKRDQLAKAYEATVPKYQAVPGLIRKYYLLSEDGTTGGGVYLFESREAADKLYDDAFRAAIKERFGAEPEIQYFETPVIVDNELGSVSTAA